MRMSFRIPVAALLSLTFSATMLSAQTPALTTTSPQAVKPGESLAVKFRGSNLAGATELWASFPAEISLAADVPNNGTNAGEVVYQINTPADAPVGVHGVRIATPTGISNLKLFLVDDLPSVAQTKPNTTQATAQALTLPCAVDGNIDSLVRNYYKFSVAAGQRLSFEVFGRRLGSPLDPMIRILDTQGRELAYSDDAPGLGGDSQLSYTFAEAGEYTLEVRDIRFQGGGTFTYRLRVGDFPCVTVPFPMAAQRGNPATITFAGSHVGATVPLTVNLPAEEDSNWLNVGAKLQGGQSSGFASLSVSQGAEIVAQEPDEENPTRFTLGSNLNGLFEKPGDVDRFIVTATKGQHFTFTGITRQQGAPTDLFMMLLKADGGQVAAAEDTGPNEGVIDYTFPADGDYTLVVEDLHRRGGSEFAYRVVTEEFQPGFVLAASADTLNVPQNGVANVTITSVRKGYNGPIELGLQNAPAGLTTDSVVLGPGINSVELTLRNDGSTPGGKVYLAQIIGTAKIGEKEVQAIATVDAAQKAAMSEMPLPPQILSEDVALGVSPQPFFVLRSEPAAVVFAPSLTATVKIKAIRTEFPEAIALAVNPAKNGLPAGITAAVKPVEKDKDEVEIVITATDKAPRGSFSINLAGTGKKGNETVVQSASIRLELQAPFALKLDLGDAKLAPGGTLTGKVIAERNPAYPGPIVLTFANLPKGVTVAEATIPEGQSEVEVTLTAAADAATGAVNNLSVKGEGTANKVKFSETAPNATLTVE